MVKKVTAFWQKNQQKILLSLLFLATVAIFSRPVLDPDFGWHFRNGQILIEQKRFVLGDEFSWTMPGYERAYNYWLSEAIFYLFEHSNLYWLLILFYGLITASALFLVAQVSGENQGFWPKVFAIIFGATLLVSFVGVRPQVISILFFAALWVILWHQLFKKGIFLVFLPLLFAAWANFHYAFLLGLAFLFGYLILEAAKFLLRQFKSQPAWFFKDTLKKADLLKLGVIAILSFGATIATPYGLLSFKTILEDSSSNLTHYNIAEWTPLTVASEIGLATFFYLALAVIFLAVSWKKINWSIVFLWFVSVFLAFSSLRHLPFLVITTTPILISLWPFSVKKSQLQSFWVGIFGPTYLILFTILLVAYQVVNIWTTGISTQVLAKNSSLGYPSEAVDFLRENPQKGRLFNAYRWGGFLIWQLPQVKTFIDGRMSGWQQNGKNPFADYLAIIKAQKNSMDLIEKYNISYVLLQKDEPLVFLLENVGWKKIHEDGVAVILRKS